MKRVIWRGVIGTVLAEARTEYFVRFPWRCLYVPKSETKPTWDGKTQ